MTRSQRRRGLTLIELIFSMALLVGLMGFMGSALRAAVLWNDMTGDVVAASQRFEIVRSQLAREARGGAQPIPALSVLPDGSLVQRPASDALVSWTEKETLLLHGAEGYASLGREGDRLIRRRIDLEGKVQVTTILRGVKSCVFHVERDPAGQALGFEFQVSFRQGPEVAGFVALRSRLGQFSERVSPRPAPRFRSRR